ncbi:H ACA ribonucleoprotein complex subunit [Musa troglodytarum]|uniref:H ACA ribonucleoprotein complex subunit n=1 Tax=Musa troglodytarum TaxID=320322 RepID=A0A9E7H8F6_9LILI|nr:H ACA ribonucleoprotein complex subunit [Musa troglodytarum]
MGSDSENEKSVKERKKMMAVAPIAKPLAGKKLCKRTLKLVRRGIGLRNLLLGMPMCLQEDSLLIEKDAAEAKCLKRGVKEVVKSVRRGHKGLCVIAGNISPIDVITHVPILLEEADIPYIYVPSKEDLAIAGVTKRPTCCVLVMTKPTKGELAQEVQEKLQGDFNQVAADVKEMASSLF